MPSTLAHSFQAGIMLYHRTERVVLAVGAARPVIRIGGYDVAGVRQTLAGLCIPMGRRQRPIRLRWGGNRHLEGPGR
jgi:hypothetical protein